MEDINTVNDVQGQFVADQTTDVDTNTNDTTVADISENNQEVATPEQGQTQSKEENSAFAEMRRKAENAERQYQQLQRDNEIARKYGQEYGVYSEAEISARYGQSHGIHTQEQLEQAIQAYTEAQQKQIDPQFYQEFLQMKQKVESYEKNSKLTADEERLSKDENYGQLYEKVKDTAKEYATKYGVDLDTGFTLALKDKANELFQQPNLDEIKQQAVKEYIEKIKSGNTPIETSGGNATAISTTPKTFEDARKGALSLIRANKMFK